jgi:predicted nuclease of predicted toxin-antitoxin system
MIIWIDAQISPAIAQWINTESSFQAVAIRDLGLREAEDRDIFNAARLADAIVLSKDRDFVLLVERLGPPPRVIWLTCGNCSNAHLKTILAKFLPAAIEFFANGESLVEIS